TLSAKHDLALAALDFESDTSEVELRSGMEELKRRLEQLLGAKPATPVDKSQELKVTAEAEQIAARREKVAAAGGELLGAAMKLIGELIDNGRTPEPDTVQKVRAGLDDCVERQPDGRLQLRFSLPNEDALHGLATTLAKMLVAEGAESQSQP
ncbi:MAG: helicase, partial [Pirellulales bacterium]